MSGAEAFDASRQSEVANDGKQIVAWPAFDGSGPTDQIGSGTEQCKDQAIASEIGLDTAIDSPAVRSAGVQSGRRCGDTSGFVPIRLSELPACVPTLRASGHNVTRKVRLQRRRLTDLHGPKCAANGEDIPWIVDLFVAQELCPRAIRCIAEVVGQLVRSIPSTSGLRRIFAQEGKTRIRVSECDHVTGDEASARESSRTRLGPSSSGVQLSPSACAGVLPSSRLRSRSNQRRTPISL